MSREIFEGMELIKVRVCQRDYYLRIAHSLSEETIGFIFISLLLLGSLTAA